MSPHPSAKTANTLRTAPAGYAVTPWIISRDTRKLLDFAQQAFAAEELSRVEGKNGAIEHAEFRIGDAVVMAFDARPSWPDTPAFLRLFVADADAVYRQALKAGATPVTDVTGLFFGDRVGRIRDPLGNIWWIQAHLEQVDAREMQRRAGAKEAIEAMAYVQESLDAAMTRLKGDGTTNWSRSC